MNQVKKMCLSCRFFRLTDEMSGVCRVDKSTKDTYPMQLTTDCCEQWSDCGQQYYIRCGWLKAQKKKSVDQNTN
jgi:hypothetical protein